MPGFIGFGTFHSDLGYVPAIQGAEEIDKLNTLSQIDKQLVEWINKYSGMITKVEKDKYILDIIDIIENISDNEVYKF